MWYCAYQCGMNSVGVAQGRNVWAEHHLQRVLPASGPHHHHRVPAAQGSAVGGPSGRLIRRALSPISGSSPLLCLNMKLVFDFSQGPPLREPPRRLTCMPLSQCLTSVTVLLGLTMITAFRNFEGPR